MKKLLLVLPLLLAFAACKEPDDDDITNGDMSTRYFYAHDTANNDAEYQVTAKQIAVGKYCIMYLETGRNISTDNIKNLAREFDNKIYPIVTENFGSPKDVGGNGKIIILLLDIKDTYTGNKGAGEGYVAGYFWAGNMYQNSTTLQYWGKHSNYADMLYVDIYPGNVTNLNCYSTMAHEFQHLVNFSVRLGKQTAEDTWIDEGLASAAEYLYLGRHLDERIQYFNKDTGKTISQGNNFFVWDGYWESSARGQNQDQLSNYATAYLFFQWLRIHASNSSGIYKEIINHEYGDYRAVVAVTGNRFSPAITKWEDLLRTWFEANFYGSASGHNGYNGEIQVTPHYYSGSPSGQHTLSLDPGEGVYSRSSQVPSSSGNNIRYKGLGNGSLLNSQNKLQPDSYLLTFNANTNNNGNKGGNSEYGTVYNATSADSELARNEAANTGRAASQENAPTLWQWDSIRAASGGMLRVVPEGLLPEQK